MQAKALLYRTLLYCLLTLVLYYEDFFKYFCHLKGFVHFLIFFAGRLLMLFDNLQFVPWIYLLVSIAHFFIKQFNLFTALFVEFYFGYLEVHYPLLRYSTLLMWFLHQVISILLLLFDRVYQLKPSFARDHVKVFRGVALCTSSQSLHDLALILIRKGMIS